MKKLVALMTGIVFVAFSAQADLVTIDFSIDENWASDSSLTSYADDVTYSEQGWEFLANEGAVRETTADRRIGDYSFRARGTLFTAENTAEGTWTGFNLWLQPWGASEPSAATAWTVEYSINSGADWTQVGVPLEGYDYETLGWTTYGATFAEQTFSAGEFQVRATSEGDPGSNDNRINIGQFQAIPEPGTMTLLVVGMLGAAAVRRKLYA